MTELVALISCVRIAVQGENLAYQSEVVYICMYVCVCIYYLCYI